MQLADGSWGTFTHHKEQTQGTQATGDKYVGEFKAGVMEGKGTFYYASGSKYEGEYKADVKEGKGTYYYAAGHATVNCYKGDKDVGEGVAWSADRTTAWRMQDGQPGESISLEAAAEIAARVGLPVPAAGSS